MAKKFTESDLIGGLKSGDKQAFEYLFDKYHNALLYFAERLVRDRAEAEDIVIDMFKKLWDRKDAFDSPINIKAFLYISTRNQCLNFIKYNKRRDANLKEYSNNHLPEDEKKQAELLMLESDLLNKVYHEMQNLPERCREVFFLTYFQGMKANEIACVMNISVSTVTTQRSLAIKYLKKVLSEKDYLLMLALLAGICEHAKGFPAPY